jgi:O-antigen ligase
MCRKVWTAYRPAVDFMNRTQELAQRQLRFQQPFLVPVIPLAAFLMSICYSTWVAAALVLAMIVALNSRRWARLRLIATVAIFAFAFNAVCCLEVAIIHSLDLRRYMTVQMYSTLFAQLLGLWFILEFLIQTWGRRQNGAPALCVCAVPPWWSPYL